MIKLIGTHRGTKRKFLGIGLTRKNIEALMQDKPIHFHAEQMTIISKIEVNEVLIFFGETEETIYNDMKDKGYLENTRIIKDEGSKH